MLWECSVNVAVAIVNCAIVLLPAADFAAASCQRRQGYSSLYAVEMLQEALLLANES